MLQETLAGTWEALLDRGAYLLIGAAGEGLAGGELRTQDDRLLLGQDTLTVPAMRTKCHFQLSGLGFGFLPVPYARHAPASGALVTLEVEEPKPP